MALGWKKQFNFEKHSWRLLRELTKDDIFDKHEIRINQLETKITEICYWIMKPEVISIEVLKEAGIQRYHINKDEIKL